MSNDGIINQMPSINKMKNDMRYMKVLSFIAGKQARTQYKRLRADLNSIINMANKYTEIFSDYGWVLYDSLDMKLVKKAIKEYELNGYESAERILIDYYKTKVGDLLYQLNNHNEELSIRYDNILNAFDDHTAGRYHASVPQFLMIADGAVNDYTKKQGFFSENTNVDAWDCLSGSDSSLKKLKELYNCSRKKTSNEPIYFPYRNGILHGRDLNYSNEIVSCKCVVLLFVIHDWITYKKNEPDRKDRYNSSLITPTWKELSDKIKKNKEVSNRINNWIKREIVIGDDIPKFGSSNEYANFPYIQQLIKAFESWQNKNYGELAVYFDYIYKYESNKKIRPKECRLMFQNKEYKGFELIEVEDRAISLKKIVVNVKWEMNGKIYNEPLEFGLNFRGIDESPAIPPNENGTWVIIPWKIGSLR